jgi:filamentous hemagglutinin family protein
MTTIHNNLRLLGKGVMGLLSRADVTATLSVLSLAAAPAFAGPEGEQVVRGDVRFERRGNEMWITAGRNSIINYRTFNIAAGETVRFIQPDAQSRVLNRVTTAAPTRIDGSLLANGRVYIVNPAGVYFGQNAVVDVNGLHAAAGRMSDSDFVRGVNRFTHMTGSVVNEGQIRANAVSLVGQQVGNFGSIVAPQGTVVLAAGQDVIVGERGGNVVVRIPRTIGRTQATVTNAGEINASGGKVTMAAGDMLGAAMFNSGRIAASDVRLETAGRGTTTVSGVIDASNANGAGGTIRVLGEHVALQNATLDASGTTGGTIMVGGNFYGQRPERNSTTTTVDAGSTLRADGRTGDAGHVVAWSDGTTRFDGMIYARATGEVGSGGVAEVSGKQHVSIGGHAYLHGKTGEGSFLIDPGSVTIVDGGNTAPGGALDTFNDAWIIDQLQTGGATLTISTANSTNAGTEDLTVDAAADLSYNSTQNLVLNGANSVVINGTINNAGTGGLSLTGGAINVANSVTVGGGFSTNGSSFVNTGAINAGGAVALTQTGTVNVDANITAGTSFTSNNSGIGGSFDSSGFTIDANGGGITITHAGDAVSIGDVDATGAIAVTGANVVQSGTADAESYDIDATGLITVNGAVTVTGTVGFTADSAGFTNSGGGSITANNAAGLININSTAGNVTLGGTLTAGTGGITLISASSAQIDQGAAVSTTGAFTAYASGLYDSGANITGSSIFIQAGYGGSGNLDLNASTLNADSIYLRAGDGASGGNASFVDFTGNPTFADTAGTGRPSFFTMRQDASIADAGIASLARFQTGSIAGMTYSIRSDAGSVTNSTANKLNGTTLAINGSTGVTLAADLSLASLDVTGATTLSADLTTGSGPMRFRNAVALGASNRSITGGAVTFDSTVTSTGGGLAIANSGTLTLGGAVSLTGSGAFNQSGTGGVALSANVSTQNQNISFNGPITVGGNATIDSGTATIAVADGINLASNALTLTGDEIDFTGGGGSVSGSGGSIVLQPSASGVTIGVAGGAGTLDISTTDLAALGTGINSIAIGRAAGNTAITINSTAFNSATTFRAGSGGTIAVNGDLGGNGAASLTFIGTTTLNADIVTTNNAITITGDVVLGSAQSLYTLDTTANGSVAGANVSVSGTINGESAGTRALDLRAGSGDVSTGDVGGTNRLSALTITSADDATFGTVNADSIAQTAGTGTTTFGDITAATEVNLVGTNFDFQDAAVASLDFFVQNSGVATFNGDITTTDGAFVQAGTGTVLLGGDITSGLGVDLSGAITLTGDSVITSSGGVVSFGSTIDGAHDLSVSGGDMEFAGDVGGTAALDAFSVTSDSVTFTGSARATTINVAADNNVTISDDFTATTLTIAGGVDGTGNLSFANAGISLSADAITLAVGDSATGGTASLNLGTNTPTFRGAAGGSTSPTSLALTQDASFTDADLPGASAFAGGLSGMTYAITSRDGSITIADADKVADTFLTLNAGLGVAITDSMSLRSFSTDSDMQFGGDLQTTGDITINGTLTLTGATGFNSGSGATSVQDVVAGSNDFAISADSLAVGGTITGSRTLVLQPGTASRDVRLGGSAGSGSFFELNGTELSRITDGWDQIYIGREDGAGLLFLTGDVTVLDPTVFRMNGGGGRMDISGRVTGADNANLRFRSNGNITLYDDVFSNGNFIEFAGNVVLETDAVVDSTNAGAAAAGADISFRGLIDSVVNTSHNLNVTAGTSGAARLEGEVGFNQDLGSLTISGGGIQLAKVSTTNGQSYNGTTFLSDDITSTTSGSILFGNDIVLFGDSNIVSAGGAGNNITITGGISSQTAGSENNVAFNSGLGDLTITGDSGEGNRVASFGATGANITTGGVRSVGDVVYNGLATVDGDIAGAIVSFSDDLNITDHTGVTATTSATFAGAILSEANQGHNIIIASPVTTFVGDVGGITTRELGRIVTSGATNINASALRATGGISLGGAVQLNNDVTFTAGLGGLEFLGGINSDSAGTPRSIVLNCSGETFINGSVGATNRLASITTSGGGTIRLAAPQIRTTATQDYASAVTIEDSTAFTGSSISFASTIDSGVFGARAVSVTANGGSVLFSQAIGGTAALSQFSVNATSFTLPSVVTTGSQTYTGITTLTGDLTSTGAGAIAFSGVSQLDADVTISTGGNAGDNVSFASTLNAKNISRGLTINAGDGNVTFGSDVGFGTGTSDRQLTSLTVTGGNIAMQGVQTSGLQFFDGTSTVRGNLTSTGAGSISFNGALILGTNLTLTTASGGIFVDATVNSDTTTRSLTLSSGGNSEKRLGGAVGATAQLSTITINGDGTTTLAAPTIKTSGNQTYSGPVTLGDNVTIQTPAAVSFVGSVDSDSISTLRTLTIDTTGGVAGTAAVTLSGTVGGTTRLSRLVTAGPGSARLGGNITVANGVDFFGPVRLLGSIVIDAKTGTHVYRSTIDTETSLSPANLTLLSTRSDVQPDRAPFKFGGNIGGTNAIANLTLGADLATPYRAATIVFTDSFDTQGRVLASGVAATDLFTITTTGNFLMGAGQKLTAFGRLRINAGGSATLGDLTSLADITVTSNNIILRARQGGNVYDNTFETPDITPADTGADYVAAGGFVFSSVPTVVGSGNAPIFASNTGIPSANLGGFAFRRIVGRVVPAMFTDTRSGGSNFLLPLDLRAFGPSAAQLATSLAGALPRDVTPGEAVTPPPISSSMQSSLADMGIQTRSMTTEETIDFLAGNATYDDVRPRSGFLADDYRVATNRLSAPAAQRAIDSYRALVSKPEIDSNGNPIVDASGNPVMRDRTAEIKVSLARAWETYAVQAVSPSGVGFRAFLENRGPNASTTEVQALSDLNAARETLTSIRAIGLSEYEASIPRRKITGMIRPDSLSDQQLLEAIFGAPLKG